MSLCINPNCKHNNPEEVFCERCGWEILLQGRYRVIRLLSDKGGFADTYEVMHHGVLQVMKVLKDSNPKAIELFEREFEVLSQSEHPGIPKAEDYFEFRPSHSSEPLYCLVMEKILGTDLEEYLNQRHNPIDERCAIDWLDQISHILQFIHARNLLHRDIKPSNIILQPNGQLTLIDFGAVGCFNHVQIAQPSANPTYIYTEGYTAPEQLLGKAVPESDFFALGRTLVYLLTGKDFIQMRDAQGEFNWATHAPQLSPELVAQLDLMMRQQVRDRPHRATELIDWVTENRSSAKSTSGFHNRSGSLATYATNPTSANSNVSSVPTVRSTGISGAISATEHVQPVVARSPHLKRKGLIIGGATIAGIALLAACAQGIGLLMNPSPNPPTTQSENSDTLGAGKLCSSPDLVQKSGNLYGVIEIGSKGVKAEVIQELDRLNDAGYKYVARDEQEDIETHDVNPTNVKAQDKTVAAVAAVMQELQDRFQIPCEQIVIYGSSGLAKKAAHKDELIAAIQTATGRKVDLISAADEAKYVFNGVVPEWRRGQVITLDIGSGNTKGAYLKNGNKNYETYEVPVGTADFARQIDKQRGETSFTLAAKAQKNAVVIPEIRTAIQLKPALLNSPRVYLGGGIAWALATLTHPCDKEQTVVRKKEERVASFAPLRAEDINTFYHNATRDRQTLFQPNLSACTPEQLKKVQKDIKKIQTESFSENELIAGAEILRAFSQELKFAEKDRIFFARYSMEALSIGYLIQQLETRSN